MSTDAKELESAALKLPARDRVRLARRLIESLDEDVCETPSEIERAWDAEIGRRVAAYRAGEVETIPATQVFEEARALCLGREMDSR